MAQTAEFFGPAGIGGGHDERVEPRDQVARAVSRLHAHHQMVEPVALELGTDGKQRDSTRSAGHVTLLVAQGGAVDVLDIQVCDHLHDLVDGVRNPDIQAGLRAVIEDAEVAPRGGDRWHMRVRLQRRGTQSDCIRTAHGAHDHEPRASLCRQLLD